MAGRPPKRSGKKLSGGKRSGSSTSKSGGPGGSRMLNERVRTGKGRTVSSRRWLERQLNDPYVAAAKEQGYRSRAAFKLLEINEAHRLLRPGMCIVDLGAAPGGWSQVAARFVCAEEREGGHVVAIDIQEVAALPGVTLLHKDFTEPDAEQLLMAALGGRAPDGVMSDMAAPATGHKQTDHLRIIGLCEIALAFARDVLKPGGFFLAKVLQGGTERELLATMRRDFTKVRHVKPSASRSDSSELYVLATGFRGRADSADPLQDSAE